MLQKISSVFIVYRRKTLTGSPDPMHVIGMDKPCKSFGKSKISPTVQRVKNGNTKEARKTSRTSRNNIRVKQEITTLTGLNLWVKL